LHVPHTMSFASLLPSHLSFLLRCSRPPRALHSFPTRRSSDLVHQADFLQVVRRGLGRLPGGSRAGDFLRQLPLAVPAGAPQPQQDRKSTRLNSSHVSISYAVFCLKKKNI